MCQVWLSSKIDHTPHNNMLIRFHQILNPLPAFKMWYSEIIDIIYYMVHHMGFEIYGIMEYLSFPDLYYLIKRYQAEIEEQNKRQQEESDRMEAQMAEMKRSMKTNNNMSNMKPATPSMPPMPNFK